MNNASADYIALMARYDALAAELAHEKEQHELAHQAVSALERERDALRALWDRWLALHAEEHDESCTPENCSMAALVADVRALRTERGADQPAVARFEPMSAHVVPWCLCCEAQVPIEHVCSCEIHEPAEEQPDVRDPTWLCTMPMCGATNGVVVTHCGRCGFSRYVTRHGVRFERDGHDGTKLGSTAVQTGEPHGNP